MQQIAVDLPRPPHSAGLVGWGRTQGDEVVPAAWWGCIVWEQYVTADDHDEMITFGAWVPGRELRQRSVSSGIPLPRVRLPVEQQLWPAPPCWPCWYIGIWTDGPPVPPGGFELVTGAMWRRKRQRAT